MPIVEHVEAVEQVQIANADLGVGAAFRRARIGSVEAADQGAVALSKPQPRLEVCERIAGGVGSVPFDRGQRKVEIHGERDCGFREVKWAAVVGHLQCQPTLVVVVDNRAGRDLGAKALDVYGPA